MQENLNKAIDFAIVDFLADAGVAFRVVGLESINTVDEVLANLLQKEDIDSDDESEGESEQDDKVLYYINDDSEDNKDSEEDDSEEE